MNTVLVVLIVVCSLLLIAVVLIQKSKGGGLAAGFQSANSALGAPKTSEAIEKGSWILMGIIAVLCIICTINTNKFANQSELTPVAAGNQMAMPENVADDVVEGPATETPAENAE